MPTLHEIKQYIYFYKMHAVQTLFLEVWCQMYCLKYSGFEKDLTKKVLETVEEKALASRTGDYEQSWERICYITEHMEWWEWEEKSKAWGGRLGKTHSNGIYSYVHACVHVSVSVCV